VKRAARENGGEVLLQRALLALSSRASNDTLVPHYLTERDHPWLRAVLDEHARFVGRSRAELRERMREPLTAPAPKGKLRFVTNYLETLGCDHATAAVPPREARSLTFRAARSRAVPRSNVLTETAGELGISVEDLELALFADLKSERRVSALPDSLNPAGLAADANLAMVRAWLRRAVRVRIAAWGNTRALVRQARLSGLICLAQRAPPATNSNANLPEFDVVDTSEPAEGIVLDISGPFALFRHTELYGRALGALLPRATWCNRFELTAACVLGRGSQTSTLVVRSGDPIRAGRELAKHDSRLEERFDNDFRRAAPEWDLVREPRPVEADGTLVFPDFELIHRRDSGRRWLLEIVGFWTPDYLTQKLRRLRAARLDRLILCIDERRRCAETDIPRDASVVRYKNRIDPASVLAIVEGR
jgi:predicted nuclease of restriction endonuclease-like RecB superfamily